MHWFWYFSDLSDWFMAGALGSDANKKYLTSHIKYRIKNVFKNLFAEKGYFWEPLLKFHATLLK